MNQLTHLNSNLSTIQFTQLIISTPDTLYFTMTRTLYDKVYLRFRSKSLLCYKSRNMAQERQLFQS